MGIARGALYQHFPNREAVLEAALAAMGERSAAWIMRSSGKDVPEHLLDMGSRHSSWSSSEYNTFVRPFFQLIASNEETALSARIIERQQKDFRHLVDLVDQGKSEGSIRTDVDSRDVAWSLLLHAWGEDIARLMGVDEFITEGASERILRRLLGTYTAALLHQRRRDADADSGGSLSAHDDGRPHDLSRCRLLHSQFWRPPA